MKLLSILAILAVASVALAQDRANPTGNSTANSKSTSTSKKDDQPFLNAEGLRGFWQGTMPGGEYLVALSKITSISKHEYLLDGNLIVTEVTIDTLGDTTLRVYQITPAAQYGNLAAGRKVIERGKDLLDRAGQRTGVDLNNMVHKHYPTTTHSKIIEFRVKDLGTLDALHISARAAWTDGKGRKFVVNE